MMLYWSYFIGLTFFMYICIALVGNFTGGEAKSPLESIRNLFSPTVLTLIVIANVLYAVGIYYGFIVSSNALPISIALGVVTSFVYSLLFLGAAITGLKIAGLLLIIIGIFLIQ